MQRLGGGSYTRKNKKGGFVGGLGPTNPSCGCDMQAGWPKFLTENIPMPSVGPMQPTGQRGGSMATTSQRGGGTCGAPPIPNYYQGGGSMVTTGQRGGSMATTSQRGGSCAACSGLPLPQPLQQGGGQPAAYNSNPVPDACPFPGTGYCEFYARGGANYGEPMSLQAHLRGGKQAGGSSFNYEADMDYENANTNTRSLMRREYETLQRRQNESQRQAREQVAREQAKRARKVARAIAIEELKKQSPVQASVAAAADPSSSVAIEQQGGANYGESMNLQARLRGGGCGCGARRGGYKPTKKNRAALKKWRKGQSIGFTMTSSLKAKGLIPRTSRKNKGKKLVSAKYK